MQILIGIKLSQRNTIRTRMKEVQEVISRTLPRYKKYRISSRISGLQKRTGVPNNGWLVRNVFGRPQLQRKTIKAVRKETSPPPTQSPFSYING
jgi:hypothetical protein